MKDENPNKKILTLLSQIAKPHCDEITDEVFKIVNFDLAELNESHKDYKQVFRVISMFSVRVSHITNGILSLISINNIYGAKILLRSLIDHAYKTDYITNKAIRDKNDTVAEEYLKFCDFAEELHYQNALDYKSKIVDDKIMDDDAYLDMLERKPELKTYSKKQIFEKANQFSYNSIHKYLNNKNNINREDLKNLNLKKGLEGFLYNAALYSDLSSFVHGGPFAEASEFLLEFNEEENNKEIFNIIEYLMMLHFFANISIANFASILDKKYLKNVEKIALSLIEYYKKI